MKRKNFFIVLIVLVGVLVVVGAFVPEGKDDSGDFKLTGELATLSSNPRSVSKTVAVCDEDNFCQDYKVICRNGEEISREEVPGAVIQKPSDWVDDRNIDYDNLCR